MISVGARLGAYEVLAPLGAGGMGEVWRARDTRLGREVAIKVLPEGFASDPERVSRFEREARLLATLNHPGIATIHGFEQSNGVSLLVLELVEGPTLAERLRRGPLTVREALQVACRIAEALEAAHDKGVIHRDLKPSNIKVFADGRVKLLDFGLAKALRTELPSEEISQSPTQTSPTEAGVVLGTAPYMSPEQARGEAVDERTDVWAFGCVLYEMLTGKRAFAGASASDVIAAILEREPDWAALPPNVPPAVRSTLGRCLKKDKIHRLRHIVDGRIELEEATAEPVAASAPAPLRRRRFATGTVAVVACAAVAAASMTWVWMRSERPIVRAPTRLNIDLSPSTPLPTTTATGVLIALSPDGSHLVYRPQSPNQIFFSPDGRWVGFAGNQPPFSAGAAGWTSRALHDSRTIGPRR
jgi:serine/threonine protein kinase